MIRAAIIGCAITATGAAQAQSIGPCDWQANAQALVEPWEQNSAVFANGAVRLAAIDTIEPAVAASYLLVLSPPLDEVGARQCRVIGFTETYGFSAIYFETLSSHYDPAVGLMFDLAVRIVDQEATFSNSAILLLTLNQATGELTAELALGNE